MSCEKLERNKSQPCLVESKEGLAPQTSLGESDWCNTPEYDVGLHGRFVLFWRLHLNFSCLMLSLKLDKPPLPSAQAAIVAGTTIQNGST